MDYILPSDSTLRADVINIRIQEWKNAEDAKHALEEQQRKDKKLRDASEKNKKS